VLIASHNWEEPDTIVAAVGEGLSNTNPLNGLTPSAAIARSKRGVVGTNGAAFLEVFAAIAGQIFSMNTG
jgi:hypothetical protein